MLLDTQIRQTKLDTLETLKKHFDLLKPGHDCGTPKERSERLEALAKAAKVIFEFPER